MTNSQMFFYLLNILLIKEIYESFDEQKYTLDIFIDLSRAFDIHNHQLLLVNDIKIFLKLLIKNLNAFKFSYL